LDKEEINIFANILKRKEFLMRNTIGGRFLLLNHIGGEIEPVCGCQAKYCPSIYTEGSSKWK